MLVFSRFTGFLVIALLADLLCLLFGTFFGKNKTGNGFSIQPFCYIEPALYYINLHFQFNFKHLFNSALYFSRKRDYLRASSVAIINNDQRLTG